MVKFKKNRSYRITFWDHSSFESMEEATPYRCEVRGLVSDINKDHIIVQCWITYENDGSVCLSSTGGYVILKKDIVEAVELYEQASV